MVDGTIIYKEIALWLTASAWPSWVNVPPDNSELFGSAIDWLNANGVDIQGTLTYGAFGKFSEQRLRVKFTNNEDLVAFTLQYGELLVP